MTMLPIWAFVINAALAGMGLLCAAYTFAVRFLHEIQVHDLKLEAHRLRAEYVKRVESMRYGEAELESIGGPAEAA
ncbi:MAG TPA: hypothetical protein VG797_09060 [Phycisphaerales bacterium]|nr:hypothetical protein [Phycisphaerales bacterium]